VTLEKFEGEGEVLASYDSLLTHIEARKEGLVIVRKFPPRSKSLKYRDIAGVKHKRLVNYGQLTAVLILLGFAFALLYLQPAVSILDLLIKELEQAISVPVTAQELSVYLASIAVLGALYYLVRFLFSLNHRLVIYRTGKNPIAVPLKLTGEGFQLLAKINQRVKEEGGITKAEAEELISERIKSLLDRRLEMQRRLVESLKEEVRVAKETGNRELLKQKLKESIQKLKAQDEAIGKELEKTGLSREEVFKKYRIRPPKEEFIDAVLKSEGLENLINE